MGELKSMEMEKTRVSNWFRELRDKICGEFEDLESACNLPQVDGMPFGKFERTPTERASEDGQDAGGGEMSMIRGGRVFEKVGVNVSTVYGRLGDDAQRLLSSRKSLPDLEQDPRFWASGISLVAHMRNPHAPAVHMNTRMFWTPGGSWFGGGTDLNPCLTYSDDINQFHAVLKELCDHFGQDRYAKYRKWADEYFFIRHRNRARGAGGIFFDDLNSGDWEADFEFVRQVGSAFVDAYMPIARRRINQPWTSKERETLLVHRGLYVEFNLVYDRGTKFGLETGHDPDAVLMSLPPIAAWP